MLTQLRNRLARNPPLAEVPDAGDAAVLIPVTAEREPRVILTVRASHMSKHAGEVAFPGGKRDEEDRDLLATVLREANEEIGLHASHVEIIGRGMARRSRFGLMVRPYVGFVDPRAELRPNPAELEAVFRVPLAHFLARDNLRIEQVTHEGRQLEVPWYEHSGYRVWGLTAVLLIDMLNRVYDFGVDLHR